jgi:hypothetical protein
VRACEEMDITPSITAKSSLENDAIALGLIRQSFVRRFDEYRNPRGRKERFGSIQERGGGRYWKDVNWYMKFADAHIGPAAWDPSICGRSWPGSISTADADNGWTRPSSCLSRHEL